MITYLMLTSLLIPVNIWAAINAHTHSDLSMRILHGVSVLVLLPLLLSLWRDRRVIQTFPAIVLTSFVVVMMVVNVTIAYQGMGVDFGWIDHLLLALAALSVEAYYLLEDQASSPLH